MTASWRTELQRRIRMLYQINLAYFEHAPAELIGFGYQPENLSLWDLQRWYTKMADSDFALMRHAQVHSGLRRDTTRNCVDIRGDRQQ